MDKSNKIVNVQPLRTSEEIEEMKIAIKRGNGSYPKRKELAQRDLLIFLLGINTGLRVNDIVRLKVKDVVENTFTIREGKTKKKREINVSMLRSELDQFIEGKNQEDYLFKSQKGDNHLTTTQVYRILSGAGEYVGRNDIGTHTMRKTFGYHHYKQYKDVAILQEIFNHESPSITRRYIGIRQDEINASLNNFRLG